MCWGPKQIIFAGPPSGRARLDPRSVLSAGRGRARFSARTIFSSSGGPLDTRGPKQLPALPVHKLCLCLSAAAPQVFRLPLFTRTFCQELLEELEHFEHSPAPKGRPNTMNNYGVRAVDLMLHGVIWSLRKSLSSEAEKGTIRRSNPDIHICVFWW